MKFRSIVLLFAAVGIAFTGCKKSNGDQPQAEAIKYVKVETISNGVEQKKMTLNGKIKEKSLTSLSFRVGGPLVKLSVIEGDYVKAGQVIAQIDKRDYQLQLQTTKAQFDQVEGEYKRYKTLVEQNKIPENTFERVESGYLMAKTAYENAQNQLKDTELKAPFSGHVYEKFTENFQTVGPGQPIVSIIDNSNLEVVVSVSETQLQQVRSGNESFLTVSNGGVQDLPVKLLSVGEKAENDGLYEVRFSLKNTKDLALTPGMTAEISLLCASKEDNLSVASSAVFHENNKDYVWIYNPSNGKIEKREITLALNGAQERVVVGTGLSAGEQVVTAGVHYLVSGQAVKPIEEPSVTNVGGLL